MRRQRVLENNEWTKARSDKPKQKLSTVSNVTNLPAASAAGEKRPLKINIGTFQAVVWKNANHENDNIVQLHEPGNGEKVALLKNWREIFKNSHPSNDRFWIRKKALSSTKSDAATHPSPDKHAAPKETETELSVDLSNSPNPETTQDGSPVEYFNKQLSAVSEMETASSSDLPSTDQTQLSSVSGETGPDDPSAAVGSSPLNGNGRKRKASASVDTEPDSHKSACDEIKKPRSQKATPKGQETSFGHISRAPSNGLPKATMAKNNAG